MLPTKEREALALMIRMLLLLSTMTIGVLVASGVAVAAVLTFSNTSQILIRDAPEGTSPARPSPIPQR